MLNNNYYFISWSTTTFISQLDNQLPLHLPGPNISLILFIKVLKFPQATFWSQKLRLILSF